VAETDVALQKLHDQIEDLTRQHNLRIQELNAAAAKDSESWWTNSTPKKVDDVIRSGASSATFFTEVIIESDNTTERALEKGQARRAEGFKPKEIWMIRVRLPMKDRARGLALFHRRRSGRLPG